MTAATTPVQQLLENYTRHIGIPWSTNLAGVERVWFAVHPPEEGQTLRDYLDLFEQATRSAGHGWLLLDLQAAFTDWLRTSGKEEAVLEDEDMLEFVKEPFAADLADDLRERMAEGAGAGDVVALVGLDGLHGYASVSRLVGAIDDAVTGRLLAFFPGRYEGDQYHLLDQGPDWNYQAIPITCQPERD